MAEENKTPKKDRKDNLTPFKVGNQMWKLKSSYGRDRIFEEPDTLFAAFEEYTKAVQKNPLVEIAYQQGKRIKIPRMRAMTIQGFCIFLGVNSKYFNQFDRALTEEMLQFVSIESPIEAQVARNELNHGFSNIIATIKEMIFEQKFTGAAAGFLNANLISRELGMLDKREVNHKNDGGAFKGQVTIFALPSNNREPATIDDTKPPGQPEATE